MKMYTRTLILFVLTLLIFSSCSRNLVYFSDLPQQSQYTSNVLSIAEPKIQSGDLLSIKVSSLSAESNAIFNAGGVSTGENTNETGYQVDKTGYINFPIVGRVKLSGLTNDQAREKMTKEVLKYVKDPIINLRLLNFKVTVIGEVARPNTFTVSNEKINLLEALGMAGDMTPYGKRHNVLVIREKEGQRTMARVDLNDKDVLNSPYFYLQQNDVVYIEPVPARAANASSSTRFLPILVGLTSIATLIISRVYLSN
jgi:polysaccharide export outer membrane protein